MTEEDSTLRCMAGEPEAWTYSKSGRDPSLRTAVRRVKAAMEESIDAARRVIRPGVRTSHHGATIARNGYA